MTSTYFRFASNSRRAFLLITTTFALVCSTAAELSARVDDSPRDIGPLLEKAVESHRVPGLAAVVLKGNQIVAQGVAGVRKAGAPERLTINDRFLLCSGTKAMTATLVAMAVEEGKLSYSSTIGEILHDDAKEMQSAWKTVTIAQLLEHRGGVPAEHSRIWTLLRLHFSKRSEAEKRKAIVGKILSGNPAYAPGSKYVYTALDYIIVGAMLEKVYGRSWEKLISERLWQPLGITTGGFGAPGTRGSADQPCGHWGMVFNGCPISPGGFWSRLSMPLYFGPGGAANMTITDWAKFISLHLRGDPANPNHDAKLLKADSFGSLHRVETGKDYAGGWYVGTRSWAKGARADDSGKVFASLGDNGFWHVEAWVAPEIDFAILVICNRGGTGNKPAAQACNDAISALMKEFLPKRE